MNVRILAGPTAGGKSAVAQLLAEELRVPVLSADSMLVYRNMDIGTAKPTASERGDVCYAGIDLVDPDGEFSVWQWLEHAREKLRQWGRDGVIPVVTGGTGLYLYALVNGLDDTSAPDGKRRSYWNSVYENGGAEALRDALEQLSPGASAQLRDPQNPRRLIRALESVEAGKPLVTTAAHTKPLPVLPCLNWSPAVLRERIKERVEIMYANGLLDEARMLRQKYPQLSRTALHAIGYREAFALLDGRLSLDEAKQATVTRTNQLAKRQRTWFRHKCNAHSIDVDAGISAADIAEKVRKCWQEGGETSVKIS